ncbi:hypothetical protein TNCV_4704921 [Trichonephila clavipes]|nr:hypothetical protein TNCV_4704921 [Trichonephila clavipes]
MECRVGMNWVNECWDRSNTLSLFAHNPCSTPLIEGNIVIRNEQNTGKDVAEFNQRIQRGYSKQPGDDISS